MNWLSWLPWIDRGEWAAQEEEREWGQEEEEEEEEEEVDHGKVVIVMNINVALMKLVSYCPVGLYPIVSQR